MPSFYLGSSKNYPQGNERVLVQEARFIVIPRGGTWSSTPDSDNPSQRRRGASPKTSAGHNSDGGAADEVDDLDESHYPQSADYSTVSFPFTRTEVSLTDSVVSGSSDYMYLDTIEGLRRDARLPPSFSNGRMDPSSEDALPRYPSPSDHTGN